MRNITILIIIILTTSSCKKEFRENALGAYETHCEYMRYFSVPIDSSVTTRDKVITILSEDFEGKLFFSQPGVFYQINEPVFISKDKVIFDQEIESLLGYEIGEPDRLHMEINLKESSINIRYIGNGFSNPEGTELYKEYLLKCEGKKIR